MFFLTRCAGDDAGAENKAASDTKNQNIFCPVRWMNQNKVAFALDTIWTRCC
jgi:hypothetical protein